MGRTGRKRAGKCVLIVIEGKQYSILGYACSFVWLFVIFG